jgi:hypothetical protein
MADSSIPDIAFSDRGSPVPAINEDHNATPIRPQPTNSETDELLHRINHGLEVSPFPFVTGDLSRLGNTPTANIAKRRAIALKIDNTEKDPAVVTEAPEAKRQRRDQTEASCFLGEDGLVVSGDGTAAAPRERSPTPVNYDDRDTEPESGEVDGPSAENGVERNLRLQLDQEKGKYVTSRIQM